MTLFLNSPDFRAIQKAGASGEYASSDWRIRMGSAAVATAMLGQVDLMIKGRDDFLALAEQSALDKSGLILASTHTTDQDMTIATAALSPVTDVILTAASPNMSFRKPLLRSMYTLVGLDNFYPVPFRIDPSKAKQRYAPLPFSMSDYDSLTNRIISGTSVVSAVQNPRTAKGVANTGRIGNDFGQLVPHLALTTGRPVVPINVIIEGQQQNPAQLNYGALDIAFARREKEAMIVFGAPVTADEELVGEYKEVRQSDKRSACNELYHMRKSFGTAVLAILKETESAYYDK